MMSSLLVLVGAALSVTPGSAAACQSDLAWSLNGLCPAAAAACVWDPPWTGGTGMRCARPRDHAEERVQPVHRQRSEMHVERRHPPRHRRAAPLLQSKRCMNEVSVLLLLW